MAGLVWRRILENAPQKPRGTHTLEGHQKAARPRGRRQPAAHLKRTPYRFHLLFLLGASLMR